MHGLICRFLKRTLHTQNLDRCVGGFFLISRLPLFPTICPTLKSSILSGTKLLSCSWMSAQCSVSLLSLFLSPSLPLNPPPVSSSSCLSPSLSSLSVQRKNDCKWVPWTTGTPINKTVSQRCRKGKKKREGARGALSLNISSPAAAAHWHPAPIPMHHPRLLMPSNPLRHHVLPTPPPQTGPYHILPYLRIATKAFCQTTWSGLPLPQPHSYHEHFRNLIDTSSGVVAIASVVVLRFRNQSHWFKL